jgi:hypothetical protein
MRSYISCGLNMCFYLHDYVRPAGNRDNIWEMMLEHVRANVACWLMCGITRNIVGTVWSQNVECFIIKSPLICSLGQLIHSYFLKVKYTLGPFELREISLKVHEESVLLKCQVTLKIISFLFCFVNLGFFEKSFIIFGLYAYFRICWIWFSFLPPSVLYWIYTVYMPWLEPFMLLGGLFQHSAE